MIFCGLVFISLFNSTAFSQTDHSSGTVLRLFFFGSSTCGECMEIKESLLKPIEKRYSPKLIIEYRDIDIEKDLSLLTAMEKGYHVTKPSAQELYFPDTVLIGYDDIMKSGRSVIESYLSNPEKWRYKEAYGDSTVDTVKAPRP
jgi:hypothetical protein